MGKEAIEPRIINVKELFDEKTLRIPEYQRPYKWTINHVNQLLDDIIHHREKSAYRLGTIVFFRKNEEELHIVDGQQRTITLLLIALAIYEDQSNLNDQLDIAKIEKLKSVLFQQLQFSNRISQRNIKKNYQNINQRIVEFDAELVQFFYQKCELVKVVLTDISEAFQFFDAQNARGKDLDPHDLLKAFHLREMSDSTTESARNQIVNDWQQQPIKDLKLIFEKYLFRIRRWSTVSSARAFTKQEVGVFKGVSAGIHEQYPYAHLSRIGHFYVDAYNKDYHRDIDKKQMPYPFQIDQIIINGKRFFEMIAYYMAMLQQLKKLKDLPELSKSAQQILETLDTYAAKDRTGDRYIRNLFDCCVLYYWDRFGTVDLSKAIEKYFIWAYSIRITYHSVQLATIDNHAIEYPYIFETIKNAIHPRDAFNIDLPVINKNELKGNKKKIKKILELFKQLKYYHEV